MSDNTNKEEEITGFVDHIIYNNEENGYTVLVLDNDITVTGTFPTINEGENLKLWGNFVFHDVYGEQFKCNSFEVIIPTDIDDIRRYLGGGSIKGIGPSLAKRIVDKFGERTFEIMENEPERLAEVKGISDRKARDIADVVLEKTRDRSAILYLLKFGIKNNLAIKIYKYYGSKIYHIIENNPYRLAEDIKGIGFKIADEIAKRTGITYDSQYRIKSGLIYLLNHNSQAGHTYVPIDILINQGTQMLSEDESEIDRAIMQLSIEKKVVIRGDKVYLSFFYMMENESASMMRGLNVSFSEDEEFVQKFINNRRFNEDIVLDDSQNKAVHTAATKGVTVITGGPGTGKTTVIRIIIEYFEALGENVVLCAPTGRAAKRITESTGKDAMTIHRLLEVKGVSDDSNDNSSIFTRGADYPIDGDVIIVDEASMVDITLFYCLLRAIPLNTRIILVGDADQLPSVGPGNVLKDIIDSNCFDVVRLTNIFRQEQRSDIVINAHKIQAGETIELDNDSKDFFFLKRDNSTDIIKTALTLIKNKLPSYVNAHESEIQVLTPQRKGNLGVISLNSSLQVYLNPKSSKKNEHNFGERIIRVGDKVMQIKNNYQIPWRVEGDNGFIIEEGLGVFNGDMGVVTWINEFAKTITVEFDDKKIVDYPFAQIDEIEHAFAVTVHKSQGSEYPAVIIPLQNVPHMLMNRNLIYTAITRAKKCVVLIGDELVFRRMVENDTALKRYTGFKEALLNEFSY